MPAQLLPSLTTDLKQVEFFLELLRKDIQQTCFRAFFPEGHPQKPTDRGRRCSGPDPFRWQKWQQEGRGLYAVIGNGGHRDAQITRVPALFVEWDNRPITWQETAWQELGLPEPTFQVFTSGKSVHSYWVLEEPLPAAEWRALIRRLIAYCGSDSSCCNPSRVMRLPGGWYLRPDGTAGQQATICAGARASRTYPAQLFKQLLPSEPPPAPSAAPAAPAPPAVVGGAIPLEELLPRRQRLSVRVGAPEGERNTTAFCLACSAVAIAEAAAAAGLHVLGSPEDLLSAFAARCAPPLDPRELATILRSAQGTPRSPDLGWPARLAWHSRPKPPGPLPPPPPSAGPQGAARGIGEGRQAPPAEEAPPPPPPEGGTSAKPIKIEAGELLALLRDQVGRSRLRFNTFTQQIEINGAVLQGAERYYLKLAEVGIKASKELAYDCLVEIAKENPFDPVREYLEYCEANVEPEYIGGIASAYLRPGTDEGKDGPSLYDEMIYRTMIGAVKRVFQPGSKHDTACVLLGPQGCRKSTFWSVLGGPFFSDSMTDVNTKDDIMILHRSWIMELAELDHITSTRQAARVKSFLTCATDVYRAPYAKSPEEHPRRGIIVGTANKADGLLVDDTGNRRFWVIPTTASNAKPINTSALAQERDALWAGAMAAYRGGGTNELPKGLEARVDHENESYLAESPWHEVVSTWLETKALPGDPVTCGQLLRDAIQKPVDRQTRADQMELSSILRSLGWVQKRQRHGSARIRQWVRSTDS